MIEIENIYSEKDKALEKMGKKFPNALSLSPRFWMRTK